MRLAFLQVRKVKIGEFTAAQATPEKNSKNCQISLVFERFTSGRLPQPACLIGSEPVPESHTQLLDAFHASNARRALRAEETGVSGLVGETADGSKPSLDCPRGEATVLKRDAVTCDHDSVNRHTRLRAAPLNQFVECVSVTEPGNLGSLAMSAWCYDAQHHPAMEHGALLAELRALADDVPDFGAFSPTSRVHHQWLGKVYALIQRYDPCEALSVGSNMGFVGIGISRDTAVSVIVGILYRVIARLEGEVLQHRGQAFGPGAVYDFFKSLRDLLGSAKETILIVDPYLDEQIFDAYLSAVSPNVAVRLLGGKTMSGLKPAVSRFVSQNRMTIEVRTSKAIHDRIIFLDGRSCWVLGQSIKDAVKTKPTYLAPLDHETAKLKTAAYEEIWGIAELS